MTRLFVFLGAIAALVAPVSAETVPPGGTDAAALFQRGDALYQRGQDRDAFPLFLQAARLGYAPAQTRVGVMYDRGRGVARNQATAATWFAAAVSQGYAPAQLLLATMYARGEGVAADVKKASELYEASARRGKVYGMFAIGVQYELGQGVARDRTRAIYWFQQAAQRGDKEASNYATVSSQPNVPRFRDEAALKTYADNRLAPPVTAPPPSRGMDCGNAPASVWQCRSLSPQCSVAWSATCRSLELGR
jgi:hypothetical protein